MRTSRLLLAVLASAALGAAQADNNDNPTAAATTKGAATTKASSASSASLPPITSTKASAAASSAKSTEDSSAASTTFPSKTSSSIVGSHLTDLPTLAGGIPTMVVPYTAGAPFMQKSDLPEGTIFIAVGGVLAFLGLCVLGWRAMVAWTINRSVKRAAMASVTSDTKTKYGPGGKLYAAPHESSLSLDALTTSGKTMAPGTGVNPARKNHRKDQSMADPSSLFFSPTANPGAPAVAANPAANRNSSYMQVNNRASTYLPAGYYASSGAQAGGGRDSTFIGDAPSLQPIHNRLSRYDNSSPPSSRGESRPRTNMSNAPRANFAPLNPATHPLYAQPTQPSTSSLAVGFGASQDDGSNVSSNLPGQRAPSAVFQDLLDEHGNGPRERFH